MGNISLNTPPLVTKQVHKQKLDFTKPKNYGKVFFKTALEPKRKIKLFWFQKSIQSLAGEYVTENNFFC